MYTLYSSMSPEGPLALQPESASLSVTLVPTFEDVVCVTDPYGCILGFLDRSRYFFFYVAPQFYSRDWVGPVPDPLLN
jgi:hypothetical protein